MKNSLLIIVVFVSFLVNSQVQWRDLNHPALPALANERQATVEFSENGDLYFIYFDNALSEVRADKWVSSTSSWTNIYSKDVSCCITNTVRNFVSKKIGTSIYVAYEVDDSDFTFLDLFKIESNETTAELLNFATSDNQFNTPFDFFVDQANDKAYFAYNKTGGLGVEEFDLSVIPATEPSITGPIILTNASSPKLVPDYTESELYLFAVDNSGSTYAAFTAAFTDLLVYTFQGDVGSFPIGGLGSGNNFDTAEKLNYAPDIVFSHFPTPDDGVYRTSLSGSNTETLISQPMNNGYSADGRLDKTYVLGQTSSNENVLCYAVNLDGTVDTIANTENPILQSASGIPTSDFVLRQNGNEEMLAGYFYSGIGNRIIRTSTPPVVAGYDLNPSLCVGTFPTIIDNLTFFDAEGDAVTLDSVLCSNSALINNANIFFSQNPDGSYAISGVLSNGGSTFLELWFSDDGVNPTSDAVPIELVTAFVGNFDAADYNVCSNGNVLNLDDLVNLPGGDFTLVGATVNTEDNALDLSELEIVSSPATYSLTYDYEDVNGCLSSDAANLIVYNPAEITMSVQNSACGNPTGFVEANVSGANGSYISYWNNGVQGIDQIVDVPSGNYYITVIDDQGCIATGQGSVLSSEITVNNSIIPISCQDGDDGEISLSITGANPPFDVFWSNGMSTATASNLVSGIYEAIITDDTGCQVTYSFNLPNPPKFEVEYTTSPLTSCLSTDGAVTFVSANGVAPYNFEWDSGATSQDLTDLGEGIYFVEVIDDKGCVYNEKFTLTSPSAPNYVDAEVGRSVCGDQTGSIELTLVPVTGEEIVDILWSNGMTTESIFNVPAGYYECVATQSDGCQSTFSWDIGTLPLERPEICIVTVDSVTTTNLIVWEKPVTNDIDHYRIYRETSQAGSFMLIDTVHYSSISVFNDVVASPRTKSWRYRISSVNQCGIESPASNIHKTIHLVIQEQGGGEYKVIWDNYEGVPYSEYDVLRYTDQSGWEVILANVPYNALPYTMDTPASIDGLDYIIEIDPGYQCTATFGKAQDYNSSRSNKARGEFNPGDGTGDPNNSILELESDAFSALIYPNPTAGDFNIDVNVSAVSNEEMTVKIISMDGKLVYQGTVSEGLNTISINNAQSGIYLVHLQKGNAAQVGRIVKH